MARCGCASDRCTCHFIAGDNVIITGTGTRSNPYVVQSVAGEGGGGGGGEGPTIPAGVIWGYGGSSPPAGWLICDGSTVSRGAFPALFAAIGTAYGAGNGTTTFRLPGGNGRTLLGADAQHPRGSTGGHSSVTLTTAHLPAHAHSMAHTHSIAHDHGRTNNSGSHDHDLDFSEATGGSWDNIPEGTANRTGGNAQAVSPSGTHDHDIPNFGGNSGGSTASATGNVGSASPTPIDVEPPHFTGHYIIKT